MNNEIPAIFNPRRVRAPSVVVTGDSPNGSFAGGGFTNILHSSNPQISTSNLLSQNDVDNVPATPNQVAAGTTLVPAQNASTPLTTTAAATTTTTTTTTTGDQQMNRKLTKCKESCCSENAQKVIISFSCRHVAADITKKKHAHLFRIFRFTSVYALQFW